MHAVALIAAAAAWSAPQTVSAPHTFISPLIVNSGSVAGDGMAAWGWQDGVGQHVPRGSGQTRVIGDHVTRERMGPAGMVGAVPTHNVRWLALALDQVPRTRDHYRLTLTDERTRTLAVARILLIPQLARAASGHAVVAWVELHGRRQIVRVSTHGRTSPFTRPRTISGRGQTTVVAVAAGRRGDLLVAFVRNGRLLVRVRRPGRPWGPAARLASAAPHSRTHWQLAAAFDDDDRAQLVWRRHEFGRPGHPGVRALAGATLRPGARRWSSVAHIERDGASGARLTPIPGAVALSYAFGPNSGAVARVRLSGAGGRFGAPHDGAPPQGGLRSVSVASDDRAGLAMGWVIPNPSGDGGGIGYAAVMPPGAGAFGQREQVTPNEAAFDMGLADSAFGFRAFWTARPQGTGPSIPVSQIHTVVRTAVRSE